MLTISDLNIYYGGIHALKGVNIAVKRGEIAAIIGSNGAGKSTLLNAISGFLKPKSGTIIFKGQELGQSPHKIVRMGISHVPEGRLVFVNLSVKDNLMLGAYLRRDKKAILADLEKYTASFRDKGTRKQIAGTMSGGEQQMLAMGRGLMAAPDLVMFDEPSLGLAPIIVKTVFETIVGIKKMGKTMLLVEQNAYQALSIADTAYVLEQGKVIMEGPAKEIRANEKIKEAYLGKSR